MSRSALVISAISLALAFRIATLDDLSLGAKVIIDGAMLGVLVVYLVLRMGYLRVAARKAEKQN